MGWKVREGKERGVGVRDIEQRSHWEGVIGGVGGKCKRKFDQSY